MESNQQSSSEYTNYHSEYLEYMNSLPPALKPIYTTSEPNTPIKLYDGALQITQQTIQLQGYGNVEYVWYPSPHIEFKFEIANQNKKWSVGILSHHKFASLTLSNIDTSVNVSINSTSMGGKENDWCSGRISQPIINGTGQNLSYVKFHVVNFHQFIGDKKTITKNKLQKFHSGFNRIQLEEENWKLTLDNLEITGEIINQLKGQGGFAITHVGKLEKLDGNSFSGEEAKDFLDIFNDFLSFTRGFRVPLILLVGFNLDDHKIWEYWDSSGGNSWRYVESWFNKNKANKLAEVFPGFVSWWQTWEDSAKLALYWYLEANASSVLEQQIILAQIALELIAYKEGQTTGRASEKLRALMTKYSIPLKIPFDKPSNKSSTLASTFIPESPSLISNLVELKKKLEEEIAEKIGKAIQENKIKKQKELENTKVDAPYVFTKIRNNIMHSKKDIEDSEKFLSEAADLGLWYLELVLLAIFEYQGQYCNRLLNYTQNGQTEQVPWASSIEQA